MKRNIVVLCGIVILASACQAIAQSATWTGRMTSSAPNYLPGEPIYLTITFENRSSKPLAYPGLAGKFYMDAIEAPCLARDVPVTTPSSSPPPGGTTSQGEAKLEPSGTIHTEPINIANWCNVTIGSPGVIGDHAVRFQPYNSLLSPSSLSVSFRIIAPKGIDRDVCKTFPPNLRDILSDRSLVKPNLLKDFPTSTYAAYVIYGHMARFAAQDPSAVSGSLAGGSFNSNSYPDETGQSKDGWKWLKGQAAADWWAKWYDIILKNHPDIWFADELRLKRAVDEISVKNYQAADGDLRTLAQDPKSPMKDKAQQYLDLMKQKGWIKG